MATDKKQKKSQKTEDPVAPVSDGDPIVHEDQARTVAAAASSDDRGEKGCQRGGDADWHPAKYVTTSDATSPVRYCEQHKPANHAVLLDTDGVADFNG